MVKNPFANAGDLRDLSSFPGLGRSPGGGHGNPLQYSFFGLLITLLFFFNFIFKLYKIVLVSPNIKMNPH